MKIIVLGSGVVGTTSAYYLARAGHEVSVIERQPGAGLETSFANAGEISPGMAAPWAAPGIPLRALQWLFMRHSPLVVRARLDPAMWRWMAHMLANCNEQRYALNKARMVRLAEYSRDCLVALRAGTGIAYDERSRGTLQVFRDQRQVDEAAHDIAVLERYGVPHAGAGAGARTHPGWAAPAGRRNGRLLQVHAGAGGLGRAARRAVPQRRTDRWPGLRRRRCEGGAHFARGNEGRRLRGGPGQLLAAPAAPAGSAYSGVSRQGLFDHDAGGGRRRRARVDGDGPTRSASPALARGSGWAARPS